MIKKLLICLGILFVTTIQAQTKLVFFQNNTTEEYQTSAIEKITFSNSGMTILKTDKSSVQKQFTDFSKIMFQIPTGLNNLLYSESTFGSYPSFSSIFSQSVQMVFNKELKSINDQSIYTGNLKSGVYFLICRTAGKTYTAKFIKN